MSREYLCNIARLGSIMRKCTINPLVDSGYVLKAIDKIYEEAVREIAPRVQAVLESIGYRYTCRYLNECVFWREASRSILVHVEPWPRSPRVWSEVAPRTVKLMVIHGVPSESIVDYAAGHKFYSDFLWVFVSGDRAYVVGPTYRHLEHFEVLKAFSKTFDIRFLGYTPPEVEGKLPERSPRTEASQEPSVQQSPGRVERISRYRAKDVLEAVVAAILEELGFTVKVDYKAPGRGGAEVEVDVLAEKMIRGSKFLVYASCKNWDKPVDVGAVREEIGRIMLMTAIPHIRLLLAPSFTESARREAQTEGFIVIETGRKASEKNVGEVYDIVKRKLDEILKGLVG